MNSLKRDLFKSVVCTAVFATVFGLVVACSDNKPTIVTGGSSGLPRLVSHLSPTTATLPSSGTHAPLIAALFQTSQQQASQIQQSFQGLSCNAFLGPTGTKVNLTGATTGFIPLQVLADPYIIHDHPQGPVYFQACVGVFSQIGGGTSIPGPDLGQCGSGPPLFVCGSGTLTNPGTAIYTDGTLSTLIVTGLSLAGKQIRCSDLTNTAVVHDSDLVQPYFVIDTNSVVLGVGNTQLPLTCHLNIDAGDEAGSLSVQWAKI